LRLRKAESLARALMRAHDLGGWGFRFNNAKKRFGYCDSEQHTLSLSRHYVSLNSEELVRDVILHEIAHALVGEGNGHNEQWKKVANSIGASPQRCVPNHVKRPRHKVKRLPRKWIGTCPKCSRETRRTRRFNVACRQCCKKHNGGKYAEAYAFVWRIDPTICLSK